MNEETKVEYYRYALASGPTSDALAAAPWATGGFALILAAFVLCFSATVVLGIKRQAPGRRLMLSGLTLIAVYFLFQDTLAQDAELKYGPIAEALTLVAYGLGGMVVATGYARLVWYLCKEDIERRP